LDWTWLWIPATLFAAAAQAGRNAVQRGLTQTLGTLGATQVRFIYGLPFALLFLALACALSDAPLPAINRPFLLYVAAGAGVQIAATALMLAAMRERAFVVVTAWTKTEPVQVALFGIVILGERLAPLGAVAVLLATTGIVLMSIHTGTAQQTRTANMTGCLPAWRPAALGLMAGACFALSAVSFRGAILALDGGVTAGETPNSTPFFLLACWTLAWALGIQVLMLAAWMLLFARKLLRRCLAAWRISLAGGLLGASASQGWFLGFALTSAANVRTLGLVEVLFAQLLACRLFGNTFGSTPPQPPNRREWLGITLMLGGVAMLLWVV